MRKNSHLEIGTTYAYYLDYIKRGMWFTLILSDNQVETFSSVQPQQEIVYSLNFNKEDSFNAFHTTINKRE